MKNRYIIIRDDLLVDPVTVISDGLLIGRLLQCELLLNHPSVSRVQAGIKEIDDAYYVFALRPKNPVILNGKPVEENEALAPGDIIEVGPFQLSIDSTDDALVIRVELRIGMKLSEIDVSDPGLSTDNLVAPTAKKPRPAPISGTKALDIFWDKRIREVGKMVRPSLLSPRGGRRSGKAQFHWTPTSDLMARWPIAFFTWALVAVGIVSVAAAYWYTNAFAPAPISKAHAATQFNLAPAIATTPNAGSCTTCHSLGRNMEERCAACHTTEAFAASITESHKGAGIGCVDCHAEHQGVEFSATQGALASCTQCHNDSNKQLYNGRKVGTPHGGTLGYPVINGSWNKTWDSNRFHALHDQRVKLVPGLKGNAEGRLSCSSCHNSFDPIDRTTPNTTCASCHATNGKPDCTSCHVQHVLSPQRHKGTKFLLGAFVSLW